MKLDGQRLPPRRLTDRLIWEVRCRTATVLSTEYREEKQGMQISILSEEVVAPLGDQTLVLDLTDLSRTDTEVH